jgi:aldose 1-epimerase
MAFRLSNRQQPSSSGLNGTIHILESAAGDRAEVWPALGFNCFSWKTVKDGQQLDLLYADPQLFDNGRPTRSGIPILFPYPNRVRGGRFTWDGRAFQLPMTDASKKHSIHGFVCRRPWTLKEQGADANSAWVTGEFQLSREDPDSQPFWPADFILRVTCRLLPGRLRVEAEVQNPDRVPLPFGMGYHPYFTVPFVQGGKAEDCQIQVPAKSFWELQESLPTGKVLPVDAARDFSKPRPFSGVTVDDVLTDLTGGGPAAPAGLRWNGSMTHGARKLHFFSSPVFRELVVFTPPHRQAFCLEPYTCPTDGVNMQGKDVGWLSVPPGGHWTANFEMVVE